MATRWRAMRMTSWSSAKAVKRRKPPLRSFAPGSLKTASACIRTPQAVARAAAQAGKASRGRSLPGRPNALDQRLLRGRRVVRASHGLAEREMPPMRKPPTGEPCAGKSHARFGGRGGDAVPTPIGALPLKRQRPIGPARASPRRDDERGASGVRDDNLTARL